MKQHRSNSPSPTATLIAMILLGASGPVDAQPRQAEGGLPETLVKNWLRAQDANQDGRIAADEATGLMKKHFKRNDTNQDGVLEQRELESLAQRLKRQRAGQAKRPNRAPEQASQTTQKMLKDAPKNVIIEADIAYRPGDSKAWRLDLVRPRRDGQKARPALVFIHGGGWKNGDKRKGFFIDGAIDYAQRGYVCITVNYRLLAEAPFPACIEDVKCAVRWLRAHAKEYNVDPERIGGYGNSAGAHLAAMLGLANPDADLEGDGPYQDQSSLLQAVCASATPTDFNLFPRPLETDPKFANDRYDRDTLAALSAPLTHVRKDAPPFFLIHGTADSTVDVKHSDTFVETLKSAGADDVIYLRIDGAGHGVFNQQGRRTKPAMAAFFARTIGNPK